MATRLLSPRWQSVGADGRPLVGAQLYTYVSGTSTPKPVYADAGLTVALSNPVIADNAGRFPAMFMEGGNYKTVMIDAAGNTYTDDPVTGETGSGTDGAVMVMRNRIVNGGMQISQENGTAGVNYTTGKNYTLDQWLAVLSSTPGGTLRVAQEVFRSPKGNRHRLLGTVPVADAALASGDYYLIGNALMGSELAGSRFGTVNATPLILRFGVRSSVPGTYCVSATNSAQNRSWVGTYAISADEAGTDLVRTIVIPGDVSGTWLETEGVGVFLRWSLGAGSSFQGAAGWQAGNIMATASQVNFMATGGAFFRLFDVSLHVDDQRVGAAPAYEAPDPTIELLRCLPFWRRVKTSLQFPAGGVEALSGGYVFSPAMRITPTITMTATVAARTNVDAAYPIASEVGPDGFTASIVAVAAGDSNDRGRIWTVDARL